VTDSVEARGKATSEWGRRFQLFRENRTAVAALIFCALGVLVAIFAPLVAPYHFSEVDYTNRMAPSFTPGHLFGTDQLGRDLLSRIIYSLRTAFLIGFGAEFAALVLGVGVGLASGYRGGRIDQWLMAATDVMYAFPRYLFAVILVTVMGRSNFALILAIGIASWVGIARLVRAQVLKVKTFEYVEAGRAMGASGFTLAFRYILPNSLGPILVATSFGIPAAMLAESGLALLGLGVSPPTPSWGSLILDGYKFVLVSPHLIFWPVIMFALTMLAFTWVGDGLRDAFGIGES
jgi:ABC-type dipeptide/oligopeptide/nickel transport system permease subunit